MRSPLDRFPSSLRLASCVVGLGLAATVASPPVSARWNPQELTRSASTHPSQLTGLPLTFVENRGQWDARERYVARCGPLTVGLEEDGLALLPFEPGRGHEVLVRLTFEGAEETLRLETGEPLPGVRNYLRGDNPARWRTLVPGYSRVHYSGVHDGIDLEFHQAADGGLEYDVLLAPGADLGLFVVRVDGASGLVLESDGSLRINTPVGPIRQSPPQTWQEHPDGTRRPVACRVRLLDEHRFGFEAPDRDPDLPLVIDPVLGYSLSFSTYQGGPESEAVYGVELDDAGNVYALSATTWDAFPTTPGVFQPALSGPYDLLLSKFEPTGALVFATYLGGSDGDGVGWKSLALDADGDVWIGGNTLSTDFPGTAGGVQPLMAGDGDAFVAKVTADGADVLYATYFGGSSGESLRAIAVGPDGDIYLAGITGSIDFPTTPGAFDLTFAGGTWDCFVTRIDAVTNTVVYSTYIGEQGADWLWALAIDPWGCAHFTGDTWSIHSSVPYYPTTPNALVPSFSFKKKDPLVASVFVSKLDSTGGTLLYSTLVAKELSGYQAFNDIAVDADGLTYVVGKTSSEDLPVSADAFADRLEGQDAFLLVLDTQAYGEDSLVYGTYIGGQAGDHARGVAVGFDGTIFLCGMTGEPSIPSLPQFPNTEGTPHAGAYDAFVTVFTRDEPNDTWTLAYSNLFGGEDHDYAYDIGIDDTGSIAVGGMTTSEGFPTTPGAFDRDFDDTLSTPTSREKDGFVFALALSNEPPAAPGGLAATAVSSSRIELVWADNSTNEAGFRIQRSLDGQNWADLTTVAADVTALVDLGVLPETTYWYRVLAYNMAGDSAWSNEATATTPSSGGGSSFADGETAVSGTVSGTWLATHDDDGAAESITEVESGGKPSKRFSYLEHKWTFPAMGGSTFEINAWCTASTDGDTFEFSWSADDATYLPLLTVSSTDTANVQSATFAAPASGTVHVRVVDTDRTQGHRSLDTVHVDFMVIR